MRLLALAASLLVLSVAGPGCLLARRDSHVAAHDHEGHAGQAGGTATVFPIQKGVVLRAAMVVVPSLPAPREDAILQVNLADAGGQMVPGHKVTFELQAPGRGTSSMRVPAEDMGDGVYQAVAAFPGAGPWRVRAHVAGGAKPEMFTCEVKVAGPTM